MDIFVDDSNKDRVSARRKYGWLRKGTRVNYRALFNVDTRYPIIGAADFFGFVIHACDVVMHRYREKEEHKPVDADRFCTYIEQYLCPVLGNYERGEPHSVVIMDNCSIHLDPRVKALIEGRGAILIYSAPYSPELIPIEYMFHQWKSYLKHFRNSFAINWNSVHIAALQSITPQQGLNYFKKTTLIELVENHPLSEDYQQTCVQAAAETVVLVILIFLDEIDE
jgi:transposase